MSDKSLGEKIADLFALKNQIKELEASVVDLKMTRDAQEQEILNAMESAGIDETSAPGIGKVYARPKTFFSYLKENEPSVIAFFKADPHLAPFVKETIHHATFQKAVEGLFEQTNTLPPNVNTFSKMTLSTRKSSSDSKGGSVKF